MEIPSTNVAWEVNNLSMQVPAFHLLACDDHPPIRTALRFVLQRLNPNAQMTEAGSGHALLERLAEPTYFDLLTLDMQLPDIPGLELLKQAKALRPGLPVLVFSADDNQDTIMTALEHGASSYITKTSPEDVLLQALQTAMRGRITLPHGKTTPPPADDPLAGLSPRQRQVLQCLLRGMSGKQISRELNITEGTVKDHTIAVFRHLNVRTRAMVLVEAQRRGIPLDFQP